MRISPSLLSYIRDHGHKCRATVDGTLLVQDTPDSEWETIPATWTAVRDWLGY